MILSISNPRGPRVALRGVLSIAILGVGCASGGLATTRYSWMPTPDLRQHADAAIDEGRSDSGVDANWIKGPASVLATAQERDAFSELQTDAERAQFVEQFWAARDPEPTSPRNEFRQEFDRRTVAADRAFGHDDKEGWPTLFGVALLVFGYPYDVTVNGHEDGGGLLETGSLAIPARARGGDEVIWRFVPDGSTGLARNMVGGPVPQFVQFGYSGGAWRMTCGRALQPYGWDSGYGYSGRGSWVGGGPPSGDVPEDANGMVGSYRGPLLTGHGLSGTAPPPYITGECMGYLNSARGVLW